MNMRWTAGLLLVVLLLGCSYKNTDTISLTPVDSIEYGEQSQFALSYIMDMDIADNKLYIADFELMTCHSFNTDDLSYISTIGSLGKGPGELLMPCDIAVMKDRILIEEYGNNRIQEFYISGNSMSVYRDFSPTLVTNSMQVYEEEVYFRQKVFNKEDNWLFRYANGNAVPVSDLSSLSDELIEKYKSRGSIQIDYTIIKNTAYMSFSKYNDFYKVNLDSEDKDLIPMPDFAVPTGYVSVTLCKADDDLLIMLYNDSGGKITTANGQEFNDFACDTIIRSTTEGKLLATYRIPRRTYLSMVYDQGYLFISELEDAVVYKFGIGRT